MAEQRYRAVLAVISDGLSISQVAGMVGVSRQTVHAWLARYEAEGLDGLKDRSHRPERCTHQMPAHGRGGGVGVAPFAAVLGSAAVGVRAGLAAVVPGALGVGGASGAAAGRDDRPDNAGSALRKWRRWERGAPMELWQTDVGRHYAGARGDVHVDGQLLRFWIGDELVKTAGPKHTSRVSIINRP